jgi:hypothetical protein
MTVPELAGGAEPKESPVPGEDGKSPSGASHPRGKLIRRILAGAFIAGLIMLAWTTYWSRDNYTAFGVGTFSLVLLCVGTPAVVAGGLFGALVSWSLDRRGQVPPGSRERWLFLAIAGVGVVSYLCLALAAWAMAYCNVYSNCD